MSVPWCRAWVTVRSPARSPAGTSGCDHDARGDPVAQPDRLAGGVGGGADRDDLVLGGGVDGLAVRGDSDGDGESDADWLAGRVGGGTDRDDRADGPFGVGDVGGLPVGGERNLLRRDADADRLPSCVGGGAD